MISERISDRSCNKSEFDRAAPDYNKALDESGYKERLTFSTNPGTRRKTRTRNKIWFNPPFSLDVKSNIGKDFFRLLSKHFPSYHKYHKLFNKNTVKLSYSCMPNMEAILHSHNVQVQRKKEQADSSTEERLCNCRTKENCPLNGQCLKSCIVYKATVSKPSGDASYLGISETPFKERYYNHTKDFNNRKYATNTELSKLIWELKDSGEEYNISWEIAASASALRSGKGRCDLCCTEKLLIIMAAPGSIINKRDEMVSKCRHRNKFTLKGFK